MFSTFTEFIEKIKDWGFIKIGRYYSFYKAIVLDNDDPEKLGRLKVKCSLFKNSDNIYIYDDGEVKGLVLVWRSFGGGKKRRYVKIHAETPDVATKLLTALTWNTDTDLFVKIRKDSSFLQSFKSKGFRFIGGRGIQLLLKRKYYKKIEEKEYERPERD